MRRQAIIASVSKRPEHGCVPDDAREKFLQDTERLLRRAAAMGADLVAFPEVYPQLRTPDMYAAAEPHDGGTLTWAQEQAQRFRTHLVWPRFERRPDGLRNTAILIDRKGDVIGRYDKMFPTIGEMEHGVIPGTECPCFETDIGRVALTICFDLNFMEIRDALRPAPPDLLVFSSMYRGGIQLQEWALDLGCHVISAIAAELGRIVDPGGQVLKLATYEALVAHRVNLNKRQLHMDLNWGKMDAMLERYGPKLTFEYYTPEGRYVIGYEGDDRDVDEILREFSLEFREPYFDRSRRLRQEKLSEHAASVRAAE
jgi:predicted amidohydrolase